MSRKQKDWLDGWMKYTHNSEPPDTYKLWVGISVIAACLRRKVRLSWGFSPIYPNMYIVLVGPSGARKGTAMAPGLTLLRRKTIPMASECTTREALIQSIMNVVTEAVVEDGKLEATHSSITIFSPELAQFLGYDNRQLMSDLTAWWDCPDPWEYKTKHQGIFPIPGVWVNLIGATTPDLLNATLSRDAVGGGLTSRIIFVYAAKKGKTVVLPILTTEELKIGEELSYDLDSIRMMRGEYKVSDDFIDIYHKWYTDEEEQHPFDNEKLEPYLTRRPDHLKKLCMILNASRNGNMILTGEDITRGIALLHQVERDMPKALGGVGQSQYIGVSSKIMQILDDLGEITFRELLSMFHHDIDKKELSDIIITLDSMRYCRMEMRDPPEGMDPDKKDTVIIKL